MCKFQSVSICLFHILYWITSIYLSLNWYICSSIHFTKSNIITVHVYPPLSNLVSIAEISIYILYMTLIKHFFRGWRCFYNHVFQPIRCCQLSFFFYTLPSNVLFILKFIFFIQLIIVSPNSMKTINDQIPFSYSFFLY